MTAAPRANPWANYNAGDELDPGVIHTAEALERHGHALTGISDQVRSTRADLPSRVKVSFNAKEVKPREKSTLWNKIKDGLLTDTTLEKKLLYLK